MYAYFVGVKRYSIFQHSLSPFFIFLFDEYLLFKHSSSSFHLGPHEALPVYLSLSLCLSLSRTPGGGAAGRE